MPRHRGGRKRALPCVCATTLRPWLCRGGRKRTLPTLRLCGGAAEVANALSRVSALPHCDRGGAAEVANALSRVSALPHGKDRENLNLGFRSGLKSGLRF